MGYGYGGYASYYGYGYGYASYYGYGYGGYSSYAAPYGHGDARGYSLGSVRTASYFEATVAVGEIESFTRHVGDRVSSVYAVRNADGTSYAAYSTYNSATGLYHFDTAYGHPGPYSGYGNYTYYARHSDGYTFTDNSTSYNYYPGGGQPSYLVVNELRQYAYADGSVLQLSDYFRSYTTHADTGSMTTIYESEAHTTTDAYGYSSYDVTSSERSLAF